MQPINLNSQTYLDKANLDRLQNQGVAKTDEEQMKAAQGFEAVMVSKFLNIIDSTVERDQDGLFAHGKVEQKFRSMMFDSIAKDMASSPETSLGMASQIYEEMENMK